MPFHIYRVWNADQRPQWFGIRVEFNEDHWVSTCAAVDPDGNELSGHAAAAPKFYGVTAAQAHRRMVDALENAYDKVVPGAEED